MKNNLILYLKFISLIAFTTITLFIQDISILCILLTTVTLLIFFSKAKHKIVSRIYPLLIIGLLVILFQVLFNWSTDLPERIILGVTAAIKIMILSLLVFLFTATTSVSEILDLFFFLPAKAKLMLTITFSMIPIILEESQKIILVQNSRGYQSKSFNIFRSLFPVIIPLLHRTLRRAEHLSMVIQSRGYDEE